MSIYSLVAVAHKLPPINALYPVEAILSRIPTAAQEFQIQKYIDTNQRGDGVWRDVPTDVRIVDRNIRGTHYHVVKFNAEIIRGKIAPHRAVLTNARPVLPPSGEIAPVSNLKLVIKRASQPDLILSPTVVSTTHNRTASEFILTWSNGTTPNITARAYVSDYNLPLKAVRIRFKLVFNQSLSGLNISEITLRWSAAAPWNSPFGIIKEVSKLRYQAITRVNSVTEFHVWKANPAADPGPSLRYSYRNLQLLLPMTYGPYLNTPLEWDGGAWWTAAQAMRTAESGTTGELAQATYPVPDNVWGVDASGIPSVTFSGLGLLLDAWMLWPGIKAAVGFNAIDPSEQLDSWQTLVDADPCFVEESSIQLPKMVEWGSNAYKEVVQDGGLADDIGYTDINLGCLPQQIRADSDGQSKFRGDLYRSGNSLHHYNAGESAGNFAIRCADPWARIFLRRCVRHNQTLEFDNVIGSQGHGAQVLPYGRSVNVGHWTNATQLLFADVLGDYHAMDLFNLYSLTTYSVSITDTYGGGMRGMTGGLLAFQVLIQSATALSSSQRATAQAMYDSRLSSLNSRLLNLQLGDQWDFNPEIYKSSDIPATNLIEADKVCLSLEAQYQTSGTISHLIVLLRCYQQTKDKAYLYRIAHTPKFFLFQTYRNAPYDSASFGISQDDGRINSFLEVLDACLKEAGITEEQWLNSALYEPGMYPQKIANGGTFSEENADDYPLYFFCPRAGTYELTLWGEGHMGAIFIDPAGVKTLYPPTNTSTEYRKSGIYVHNYRVNVTVTAPGLCTLRTCATYYRNLMVSVSPFPEAKILSPGVDYFTFISQGVYIARDGSRPRITVKGWTADQYQHAVAGTFIRDYRKELGFIRGNGNQMTIDFSSYPSDERAYLALYTQGGGRCFINVDRDCLFLADSKQDLSFPDSTHTAALLWSLIPT